MIFLVILTVSSLIIHLSLTVPIKIINEYYGILMEQAVAMGTHFNITKHKKEIL